MLMDRGSKINKMYNDFAALSQPHFDVKRVIPEKGQAVKVATLTNQDVYGGDESALERWVLAAVAFLPVLVIFPLALYAGSHYHLFIWQVDLPVYLFFNYWRGLGITLIFHRDLTHATTSKKGKKRGFVLDKRVRMFFMIGGHLALQTKGDDWGSKHRKHHRYSDSHGDPHSPWRYVDDENLKPGMPGYRWAQLRGMWWAHFGWMQRSWQVDESMYYGFEDDKELQWCRKHYFKLVIFSYIGPLLAGLLLKIPFMLIGGWSFQHFLLCALFTGVCAGVLNIAFVYHVTWCVNSLSHVFGVRPFKKVGGDRSTDLPFWEYGPIGKSVALVLAFVSNGEMYHAGHHAIDWSPKHALAWKYHVDITWYVIRFLAWIGLATVIRVPSREEVARLLVPDWKHANVLPLAA